MHAEITAPSPEFVAKWDARAKELVEQSLCEWDTDVLPLLDAAMIALRIMQGEASEDELAGWWDEDDPPACICPPDLVARGGFKGGCPVHRS